LFLLARSFHFQKSGLPCFKSPIYNDVKDPADCQPDSL